MITRSIAALLAFVFFMSLGPTAAYAYDPAMEDYTATPLFLAEAVQPNILIIFDNSGSMNFMTYGYHEDGYYHPDDFGAIVTGFADGGDQTTLVDNDATFTEKVEVGDLLHNIDDGSVAEIEAVTDTTLTLRTGMFATKRGVPHVESNDDGERYWVESETLKNPSSAEEGYYGYFVPTAHYDYSSNVFVRNDATGEWSGNFLNWLSMRRVDVARKVMMGGLATSRTGSGNQHLIGEDPAQNNRQFPKIPYQDLVSDRHSPYDNTHFYRIVNGDLKVYKLPDGQEFDFTKDLTFPGNKGPSWALYDGNMINEDDSTYTVSGIVVDDITGTADGIWDQPKDENAVYKYFLFDPDKDFPALGVAPNWGFENLDNDLFGIVGAVPATGQEIITAFEELYPDTSDQLLYDMFNYAGGDDGYVKCIKCNPDIEYRPCDGTADWAECQANNAAALNAALDELAGHLLIFTEPLEPDLPRGNNYEEAYRLTGAVAEKIATHQIEVDRNEEDPDEARDFLDGNLAGIIQRIGDRARFGLEFYNSNDPYHEGGDVVEYVGSGTTDLINRIQNKSCETWTPLAESLYDAIDYFQNPQNNTWDAYYFNDLGRFVECSKSFILQITDGESTQDQDIPEDLKDYDGDENDPGSYPDSGSDYLDDVALYGHINDLRDDLDGEQSLYYYPVFAFGSGSTLLKDAARNGAFEDVNDDDRPEPPDGNRVRRIQEWDRDDNGVPDTYFEAASGLDLERAIHNAIMDILATASSGTAVALPSTSGREQGLAYQAYFKPQKIELTEDIKYIGYLQPLWVDEQGNLREDTVADARLVPREDKIMRYRFDPRTQQTYVDRYADNDGNYFADSSTPESWVILEDLNSVWEAGKKLALMNPANRRIFTFVDADWKGDCDLCSGIPSGTDFSQGETKAFTLTNLNEFEDYLDVLGEDTGVYSYLGDYTGSDAGTVDLRAENLVRFIRGEQLDGLRSRRITVDGSLKVWRLGDIVYSSPTVVSAPAEAYDMLYSDPDYADFAEHWKDRDALAIVGANDGMLHAFRAGRLEHGDDVSTTTKHEAAYVVAPDEGELGSEAWAYIPFNLLPHLKWLADPDYTHVYYVDQKVKVGDVQIFDVDSDHPHGWGTLLVGGMRLGGGPYPSGMMPVGDDDDDAEMYFRPAYFMLDITDPESPEVLAEFTHPNLGFTTSYPAFTKVGEGDSAHWYVIFGSGPTPGPSPPYEYDGTSDQQARVFVIDLTNFMGSGLIREGLELFIFQGTDDEAMMADPISVDKPLNYSADVIYIGESYWHSKWKGKMRRIKTNGSTNPNDWEMSTLFKTADHQAISAPPSSSVGFGSDLWVFFGTGKYLSTSDRADTHTQSLYGIHDTCMETGGSCAALQPNDLYDVSDITVTAGDSTAFDELETPFRNGDRVGWRLDLPDSGERCLVKPSLLGGAVLVPTFIPDTDICSFGGDGKLYGLYFLTGTAHYKPMIGTNESGESIRSKSIGKGMPASVGIHVGKKAGGTGFVQTSTGSIVEQEILPPLKFKSGGVSWKQF
jgi:type IV pilus assembly protein PilY1